MEHKIPELVGLNDIKCDLHIHTKESNGLNTTGKRITAAIKNYDYIAITSQTKSLKIANGMNNEEFINYFKKIDKLNKSYKIKILNGS